MVESSIAVSVQLMSVLMLPVSQPTGHAGCRLRPNIRLVIGEGVSTHERRCRPAGVAMNVDSAAARLFSAAFIAATAWRRAANR